MPWTIEENGGTCEGDTPWAVLDEDGATDSCHESEAEAQARVEALEAQESPVGASGDADTAAEGRWEAVLVIEDERTADGREISPGALGWRTLPLPLMLMTEEAMGHEGSRIAGSIETIERVGNELAATGSFDAGEDGQEAQRLVAAQTLRWVSADISATEYELIEEGDCSEEGWMAGECRVIERVNEGLVMGATICPFPAFPTAVIVPAGYSIPEATENGREAAKAVGVIAAAGAIVAASIPVAPPASWFDDPGLPGPTPMTVEDTGRVYGHLAQWGTCHTGISNVCTTPPRSPSNYAYARTGEVVTAEGSRVAVGHVTLGGGHADGRAGFRAAASHYDDTGAAVADVAYGEDAHGIWFAGALRPGVTEEQIRELRASAPSGDWRRIGGAMELVANLAVNVPGFPLVRSLAASGATVSPLRARATVSAGEQVSLVAAGVVVLDPVGDRLSAIEAELTRQRKVMEPLLPLAVERLTARIAASGEVAPAL